MVYMKSSFYRWVILAICFLHSVRPSLAGQLGDCDFLLYEMASPSIKIWGHEGFPIELRRTLASHIAKSVIGTGINGIHSYVGTFSDQPELFTLAGRPAKIAELLKDSFDELFQDLHNLRGQRLSKVYQQVMDIEDESRRIYVCMLSTNCAIRDASWTSFFSSEYSRATLSPSMEKVSTANLQLQQRRSEQPKFTVIVLPSSYRVADAMGWIFYAFGVASRIVTIRQLDNWVQRNIDRIQNNQAVDPLFEKFARMGTNGVILEEGFVQFMTEVGRSQIDIELGRSYERITRSKPPYTEAELIFNTQIEAYKDVGAKESGRRFMSAHRIVSGEIFEFERQYLKIIMGEENNE